METRRAHWNAAYEGTPTEQLGWYETVSRPSLRLISETGLTTNARLLDAGAGRSCRMGGG